MAKSSNRNHLVRKCNHEIETGQHLQYCFDTHMAPMCGSIPKEPLSWTRYIIGSRMNFKHFATPSEVGMSWKSSPTHPFNPLWRLPTKPSRTVIWKWWFSKDFPLKMAIFYRYRWTPKAIGDFSGHGFTGCDPGCAGTCRGGPPPF